MILGRRCGPGCFPSEEHFIKAAQCHENESFLEPSQFEKKNKNNIAGIHLERHQHKYESAAASRSQIPPPAPLPPPSSPFLPPHSSFILTSSLWKHELSEVGGQLQEGIKGVRGADWENKLITETPPHPPPPPTPLHPQRHPEPIWSTFQSRPLKCCQPLSPGRKLPPREVPCLHLGKSQSVEGGYLCMCVCVWGGGGPRCLLFSRTVGGASHLHSNTGYVQLCKNMQVALLKSPPTNPPPPASFSFFFSFRPPDPFTVNVRG